MSCLLPQGTVLCQIPLKHYQMFRDKSITSLSDVNNGSENDCDQTQDKSLEV